MRARYSAEVYDAGDSLRRDPRGGRAARRAAWPLLGLLAVSTLAACGEDTPVRPPVVPPVPGASHAPDRPVPDDLLGTPQGVVAGGDLAGVQALLQKPPLPVDGQGRTLLHVAAIHGRLEIARLLLERGLPVDGRDAHGQTPLHAAAYGIHWIPPERHGMRLYRGCGSEQAAVARLLLERGADLRARDDRRSTPLHLAAKGGNLEVARLLLEKGADVRAADEDGTTPLHEAASGGCHEPGMPQFTVPGDHAGVASLLLAAGADPNATSMMGTPLVEATRSGATELAKLLLAADASPSVRASGAFLGPALHGAAYEGQVDLLRAFLEKGTPIETRDGQGRTALSMGALAGREDVVRFLLERGASVEVVDSAGSTALHAAARSGHVATLALLVNRGGDVRAKDGDGGTLLHAAAGGCRAGGVMLDYLLEKGLEIDARDSKDRTPLALAEASDCLIGGSPMIGPLQRRGAQR